MTHTKENPVDVVVIGAGNAAFTAALAARRAGCEVVVLEKAPEPFRGGNTPLHRRHLPLRLWRARRSAADRLPAKPQPRL
jgi:succinate dehydrogenase/fumarate reductase flavoprotein subunit